MEKKNKSGFTLIELLIVIAIIAILAAIIIASTGGATVQARDSRRISDLDEIGTALSMYYSKNGSYPDTLDPLVTDGELSVLPTDPKDGDPYGYGKGTKNGVPRVVLQAKLEDENNRMLANDIDESDICYDDATIDCTDTPTPYYCICR
ncbi:MAG TPA: prepilin-type N-terminal cleavage/methylation domain-containing protein [Candidatus Pacearchaeota archaeon]|nr:prepilin-type N-terminal cleavage/methylation domain-containing protein [Candidatus Pacearchaeota archaeon]HOK94274.1 prepilin-type N-terminal cleavage/methylation domain-containing protein [Candidatus Pacearchaeota archaeon]